MYKNNNQKMEWDKIDEFTGLLDDAYSKIELIENFMELHEKEIDPASYASAMDRIHNFQDGLRNDLYLNL